MRNPGSKVQRFIEGTILYGVSPLLGLLLLFASIAILVGSFQKGAITPIPLIFSAAFLLIGLGLLQFSYLVFFKKESRLSSGVVYLASIFFMILGVVAAIYLLITPSKDLTAFQYGRAPGIFFIGLLGFKYARKKNSRTSRCRQGRQVGLSDL